MTKVYLRERPARRAAAAAEPHGGEKSSSYLADVRASFQAVVGRELRDPEQPIPDVVHTLWVFVSKKLAQSYWNGVEAGASGRVKPKPRARGENAEGE